MPDRTHNLLYHIKMRFLIANYFFSLFPNLYHVFRSGLQRMIEIFNLKVSRQSKYDKICRTTKTRFLAP